MRYGRLVHLWHGAMGKIMLIFFAVWMLVALGIVGSAIVDVVFNLGWGYQPRDALFGLLFIPAGCLIMTFIWAIHRLVGGLNHVFFGPAEDDVGPGPS